MTTRPATTRRETPTGREEVAAAILAAATDLFAQRGPAATSIRDIAAESKVNHGLVFRHFGTKENLVGAVLDHLGEQLTELRHSDAAADVLDTAMDKQMRVLARTILDGYPAAELQTRFPNVAELLEHVQQRHDSNAGGDTSARLAVANALALQFGWRLFEPMLRAATGLEDLDDAELRQAIGAQLRRIVEPQ